MAQINPFRFSSEFHDDETGLVYYNYRYYSPELGRWTKRDPIGEKGELNLFAITHNNLIYGWDYLGCDSILGDIVKHTLLVPSYVGGFVISVFSGDIFFPDEGPSFVDKGCDFLITINGMFNTKSDSGEFRKETKILPEFSHILDKNAIDLHNPTTYVGDFIQVAGDEIGLISISSIRAAQYINAAGDQADKNKCGNCFTINIVAHSQGTSVFRNALPLIKDKYKKHINFIGIGGQRWANALWGIGKYENNANFEDLVPLNNLVNPLHWLETSIVFYEGAVNFRKSGRYGIPAHDRVGGYMDVKYDEKKNPISSKLLR
jgi:RHS repeat-associated protein